MYIREVKTTNKKTGKVYVKHVLSESVRVNGSPRPRTVMHLGRLELPRDLWPQLAAELTARLTGQQKLDLPGIKIKKRVQFTADQAMATFYLREEQHRSKLERKTTENETLEVRVDDLAITHSRSFGPELVCHHTWNELQLPKLLKTLGFNAMERSMAEAVVAGRLIAPGSELSTWKWIRKHSSIGELTEESLDKLGLNRLYRIGDKLLLHKDSIEKHLLNREKKLHPNRDMLYLFDLTNFHFEGQCLNNNFAHRGKSKQKRSDCPLVSLGLIVDSDGFPVSSKIFPGNVSEPQTLREILEQMGLLDDNFSAMRPTLVMDRGIATIENIDLLKEYGFPYILITRGPRNKHYLDEFSNYKTDEKFETIERNKKQIHIKKVQKDDDTVEILCISEGKRKKETAMKQRWIEHATEDFASLQRSVRSKNKGTVKTTEKIYERIGRLKERYSSLTKYFEYKVIENPERHGYALDLEYEQLAFFDAEEDETDPLSGSYVIETRFTEKNAQEIWQLYMTLTMVEAAFRSIKSDLGTRPFYHQGAERTEGHLFIAIMAYHFLCNIEYKMKQKDDYRQWQTIRADLVTHQRATIIITDKKDKIHHIRVSGQPEPEHKDIYDKLGIKVNKNMKRYFIAKRL
jgi:transposase